MITVCNQVILSILVIFTLLMKSDATFYRRFKSCSRSDPIPRGRVNLDDISGVAWHVIRQTPTMPSSLIVFNSTVVSDTRVRWFFGIDKVIATSRNGDDPGICKSNFLEFGTSRGRNTYSFIGACPDIMLPGLDRQCM